MHPWIRLNRVVRDIPSNYILGGVDAPNMREEILSEMRRQGKVCRCIRCREVGDINRVYRCRRARRVFRSVQSALNSFDAGYDLLFGGGDDARRLF